VSTEVRVPFAGSCADEGLKEQATPAGAFRQANVNWSVKPFEEVRVTFTFVELPTLTVAAVLETAIVASSIFNCAAAVRETPEEVPLTMKL